MRWLGSRLGLLAYNGREFVYDQRKLRAWIPMHSGEQLGLECCVCLPMCMFLYKHVYACVWRCMWRQEHNQTLLLLLRHHLVFEAGSLLVLKHTKQAKLAAQKVLRIHLSLHQQHWVYKHLPCASLFFYWVIDSKLKTSWFYSKQFTDLPYSAMWACPSEVCFDETPKCEWRSVDLRTSLTSNILQSPEIAGRHHHLLFIWYWGLQSWGLMHARQSLYQLRDNLRHSEKALRKCLICIPILWLNHLLIRATLGTYVCFWRHFCYLSSGEPELSSRMCFLVPSQLQ